MKKETIIVKNLKKAYGTKTVTDDVSVTFYSGEIVSLVGHNGVGKTTFLNQLMVQSHLTVVQFIFTELILQIIQIVHEN